MKETDDRELDGLLKKWEAPSVPPSLKRNLLHQYRHRRRWNLRRLFTGSLQVPVPVAILAGLAILGLSAVAIMPKTPIPPPPPQIIANVVKVPIIQQKVVTRTVYRERSAAVPAPGGFNLRDFQPVACFVPRIIRSGQYENQN